MSVILISELSSVTLICKSVLFSSIILFLVTSLYLVLKSISVIPTFFFFQNWLFQFFCFFIYNIQ